MSIWILISFFGILGTLVRAGAVMFAGIYAPWLTLATNIVGCFVIGNVQASQLSNDWKIILSIGFLGALTTFSGFAFAIIDWVEIKNYHMALIYFFSTNFTCLAACYVGYKFGFQLR